MHDFILHDPSRFYWEGGVVDQATGRALRAQGVSTIPVEPALFDRNGVAGVMVRRFGAGLTMPSKQSGKIARLILFVTPELMTIHWRVRLQQIDSSEGVDASGVVRLLHDTGQDGIQCVGAISASGSGSVATFEKLGPADNEGGWTVGGEAKLSQRSSGMLGLQIYGMARNMRVAWCAVSQTE